jgi:F0F1-type ATP synthase assembly protein I
MTPWLAFVAGVWLGALLGWLLAALCAMAATGER